MFKCEHRELPNLRTLYHPCEVSSLARTQSKLEENLRSLPTD